MLCKELSINFFTPVYISNANFNIKKNKKSVKINSRNFTYDGVTKRKI